MMMIYNYIVMAYARSKKHIALGTASTNLAATVF